MLQYTQRMRGWRYTAMLLEEHNQEGFKRRLDNFMKVWQLKQPNIFRITIQCVQVMFKVLLHVLLVVVQIITMHRGVGLVLQKFSSRRY